MVDKLITIPYDPHWPVFSQLGKVLRKVLGETALRIDYGRVIPLGIRTSWWGKYTRQTNGFYTFPDSHR
jgi:hypothetical protein